MPNCFQLCRDGAAVPLLDIDEEMCRYFGVACDPKAWHHAWYDIVGYALAMGRTFDEIRARYEDPHLREIVDWLANNFTPRAWYELKSHPRPDGGAG